MSDEQKSSNVEVTSVEGQVDRREYARSLGRVAHKVIVMSGKGGVGKSTVAVNLAMSLAMAGRKTGLLDVDLHGPSVPRMLGLQDRGVKAAGNIIFPEKYEDLFWVMSIGFMLKSRSDAIIWRGPSKIAAIQQLLRDVQWQDLDFLIIDAPPGTGDEPLTVCQALPDLDGAIIVTTPQDVAIEDVRKSVTFCRKLGINIIGIVENMSELKCPHCGGGVPLYGTGGGERLAKEEGVPFLGKLPFDNEIMSAAESGKPFVYEYAGTEAAISFSRLLPALLRLKDSKSVTDTSGYADVMEGEGDDRKI